MTSLFKLLIFTACYLIAISCNDNGTLSLKEENSIILSAGVWKMISLKVGPSVIPMDDCISDNLYRFEKGNRYTQDEGPTKCDQAADQSTVGEWSIASDGKTLTITIDGTTLIKSIKEISQTQLKLQYELGGVGQSLQYSETYALH